jgi:F-type H+-transporting ATPase subunit epsilon
MILNIVSPESVLFDGEIISVAVPGVNGNFQILNNHAPIVSILQKGTVTVNANTFNFGKEATELFEKVNEQTYSLPINSGTIEMKNNKLIILVD